MFALLKQSDARQVRKVLAGHREAFGPLVERYLPAVYAVAYAQTGNHADAEDAAQEAFLSAFQSLHTLREPGKFEGWVVAIARRAAAKLRERKSPIETSGAGAMDESTTPDPARQELRRLLREAIEGLDDEPREVLLLHYFAGLSAAEIAGALDITREAAKKRLQRARHTLSDNLLAVVGDEAPPDTAYQKQRTAIMGLVGASVVAWGSGAAAAGAGGVWSWFPGGGLGAGIAVTALFVAGGAIYLLAGGAETVETDVIALVAATERINDAVDSPGETALSESVVAGEADSNPPVEASGPVPALAGFWKACGTPDLFPSFGHEGDIEPNIICLEQAEARFSIYPAAHDVRRTEFIRFEGNQLTMVLPAAVRRAPRDAEPSGEQFDDFLLPGTLLDENSIYFKASLPGSAGQPPRTVELSVYRLSERQIAEFEITLQRQEELRQLAKALRDFRSANDSTYPAELSELNDGYLGVPQLGVSGGSRIIEYSPDSLDPSMMLTRSAPNKAETTDSDHQQALFRREEDALSNWPEYPYMPPLLRIRYTVPPMILQIREVSPGRVERVDLENTLRCPTIQANDHDPEKIGKLTESCQNNMKQLGLSVGLFQNDDAYKRKPAGWAMMFGEYIMDNVMLTCPGRHEVNEPGRTSSYALLFATISDVELTQIADELGMDTSDPVALKHTVPMIVENHPCVDGSSRNVVFWDGHAERVEDREWTNLVAPFVEASDAYREGP